MLRSKVQLCKYMVIILNFRTFRHCEANAFENIYDFIPDY